MVNTLVLYQVAGAEQRRRLESLLQQYGFVWLGPGARWTPRPPDRLDGLSRSIRRRLAGKNYRLVMMEITPDARARAQWISASEPPTPPSRSKARRTPRQHHTPLFGSASTLTDRTRIKEKRRKELE